MSSKMPSRRIDATILTIRGQRVMLDADLAALYGVPTKALNRAIKRNRERFPGDFMFQLTTEDAKALRYQNGTSILRSQFGTSKGRGGRRYLPYVFAEQGVAMLSSVLRSRRAVLVNIEIMRAFIRFRAMAASHRDLLQRLDRSSGSTTPSSRRSSRRFGSSWSLRPGASAALSASDRHRVTAGGRA